MVREFMITSGQGVDGSNIDLNLRNKLFTEEIDELSAAVYSNDRIEQLDGICDTLYIISGTAVAFGSDELNGRVYDAFRLSMKDNDTLNRIVSLRLNRDQFQYSVSSLDHLLTISKNLGFSTPQIVDAFRRVHSSNMTKFCKTKREANDTMLKYLDDSVDCSWIERNGKFVVTRDDGKILKSVYYKPVILEDLV